jgi:hypothetical protein
LASLATFNFGNFQFWQLSILVPFNFGNLQFWQLSILKLSVLTIFNLGYFQAKSLNGAQEEEEQQQQKQHQLYGSCDQKRHHLGRAFLQLFGSLKH